MSRRKLFDEMMQGIDEMTAQRDGQIMPSTDSHDSRLCAKVQEAMNSTQPKPAHDEAISKVQAELEKRRSTRDQGGDTELI